MKKVLFAALLVVLIGISAAFFYRKELVPAGDPSSVVANEAKNSLPAVFEKQKENLPPLQGVNLGLLHTIAEEAPKLDSMKVDADAAELKAIEQAEAMSEGDMEFLVKLVRSESATANQKIYSIYLLDMGKAKAWRFLKDIALTPLKERVTAPHTVDEAKAMQEKSLVFMAIDALAEQAKTDEKAKAELAAWAETAPSREAQEYILEKLKELSETKS